MTGAKAQLEAQLGLCTYRELQQRAKEAGVKSNGKASDIVGRIIAQECGQDSQRTGGVDKEALKAAAGTPLPRAASASGEGGQRSQRSCRRRLPQQETATRQQSPLLGIGLVDRASPLACRFDAAAALRAVMPKGSKFDMQQATAAAVLSAAAERQQFK